MMIHHHNKDVEDILNDGRVLRLIDEALLEDIGLGDVTTDAIVLPDTLGHGDILVKEEGIVAGIAVASHVFQNVDSAISFKRLLDDGTPVEAGTIVAAIDGPLAGILKAERTALNFLQRMS